MTAWPTTLPLPRVDYSGTPRHAILASSMESARIQRRTRFHSSAVSLSVQWILTAAQFIAFEDFFEEDLHLGCDLFEIELRYPKNSELAVWVSRIVGGYSANHMDGMWEVSADLDLLHSTLNTAAALAGWVPFLVLDSHDSGADYSLFEDAENFTYHTKQ